MVTDRPTPIATIQFQPETESCQSLIDPDCRNDPEWVVEFGSLESTDEYTNLPSYVCTDCLPATIDLALEKRLSEIVLQTHECNAVQVAKYLPTTPTIQPDRTLA